MIKSKMLVPSWSNLGHSDYFWTRFWERFLWGLAFLLMGFGKDPSLEISLGASWSMGSFLVILDLSLNWRPESFVDSSESSFPMLVLPDPEGLCPLIL